MKEYEVVIEENGTQKWYNKDGQLHCEHGTAVIYANGKKEEYW